MGVECGATLKQVVCSCLFIHLRLLLCCENHRQAVNEKMLGSAQMSNTKQFFFYFKLALKGIKRTQFPALRLRRFNPLTLASMCPLSMHGVL